MTEAVRVGRGPGSAHSPLSYGLHDRVMRVDVLEKVKQARSDTLQHFAADVLGVHGPQWNDSNALSESKHVRVVSDTLNSNTVQAEQINSADVRSIRSSTFQPTASNSAGSYQREHATGGWDQSTCRNPQQEAVIAAAFKARSMHNPLRQTLQNKIGPVYVDPVKRQEQFNESMRKLKHEQSPHVRLEQLTAKYGVEGARAMLLIEKLPVLPTKPRKRTQQEDIAAVRALCPLDDDSDEELQQQGFGP